MWLHFVEGGAHENPCENLIWISRQMYAGMYAECAWDARGMYAGMRVGMYAGFRGISWDLAWAGSLAGSHAPCGISRTQETPHAHAYPFAN